MFVQPGISQLPSVLDGSKACGEQLRCTLPMLTTRFYYVAHLSHVAMFNIFGGANVCYILRLRTSASYRGLNHHDVDDNGDPDIGHLI